MRICDGQVHLVEYADLLKIIISYISISYYIGFQLLYIMQGLDELLLNQHHIISRVFKVETLILYYTYLSSIVQRINLKQVQAKTNQHSSIFSAKKYNMSFN